MSLITKVKNVCNNLADELPSVNCKPFNIENQNKFCTNYEEDKNSRPTKLANYLYTNGNKSLEKEISCLVNFDISKKEIPENASTTKKVALKTRNALATYHSNVIQGGDKVSRKIGKATYMFFHTLFVPVRLLAEFLGGSGSRVGVAQEAVSLAFGFAARAISLVAIEIIGNILPYALILGIGVGAAFASKIVGPIIGTVLGVACLILAIQQAQIFGLAVKANDQSKQLKEQTIELSGLKEQIKENQDEMRNKLTTITDYLVAKDQKKEEKENQTSYYSQFINGIKNMSKTVSKSNFLALQGK